MVVCFVDYYFGIERRYVNGFNIGRYFLVNGSGSCDPANNCAPPRHGPACYMHYAHCGEPTQSLCVSTSRATVSNRAGVVLWVVDVMFFFCSSLFFDVLSGITSQPPCYTRRAFPMKLSCSRRRHLCFLTPVTFLQWRLCRCTTTRQL